jgi:hypothetical protein
MSTRSAIIIEEMDGRSKGIYCHCDGYIEHHRPILLEYYATEDLARELVELGALSILGRSIGRKCDFDRRPPGQCLAYRRDRGETDESSKPVEGQDWLKVARRIGHDCHVYVFRVATQSWWYEGEATGAINGRTRGGRRFVPLVRVKSESDSPSPHQEREGTPRTTSTRMGPCPR